MLTVAIAAKLIAEIALLALAGQWLVGLMAGASRRSNPIYSLFQLLGKPWLGIARWLSPSVVLDRHVPLVAVFLLLMIWCVASYAKVVICLQIGVVLCK